MKYQNAPSTLRETAALLMGGLSSGLDKVVFPLKVNNLLSNPQLLSLSLQLELDFIFFRQRWDALITENQLSAEEIYFIDEGTTLPFFLKSWKHRHLITNLAKGAEITDDVTYEAHNLIMGLLLYPVLYLQFLYRKPIYKKFFTRNQEN